MRILKLSVISLRSIEKNAVLTIRLYYKRCRDENGKKREQ